MENTSQQLDQMQEMVNKLIAEQQAKSQVKPVTIPIPVSQPQAPAQPKPQPKRQNKPEKIIIETVTQTRPDKKDFYDKTWVAFASTKKFPFAEKDIRTNLTNEIYASLKDTFIESESETVAIMEKLKLTNQITIGSRTDRVVAKIKELGLVHEIDIKGILRVGEEDEGW